MTLGNSNRNDATNIRIPLQMFLAAVGTAVVLGGAFYAAVGGVRSDLSVMSAKIDGSTENAKLRDEFTKAQLEAVWNEIKSLRGKSDLLQLQQQQLQLELAKGKR